MTQVAQHHGAHTDDEHGHDGSGKYIAVFLVLCVLTGASFFTTSTLWPFQETKSIGWAFMMAVSCTKAMLVILFFMHLLWEANWKYVLTIPAAGMSIFLVCMLVPDVGMRVSKYSEERQLYAVERSTGVSHGEGHSEETGDHAGQPPNESASDH